MSKSVGIIGGGISGLVTAFLLQKKGFNVEVFDKKAAVGGNIQTRIIDGFLIEQGPNSLLKSPRLVELIKALNLENEIIAANPTTKKRYILQTGKLRALPMSIAKIVFDGFFSWRTKLRWLKEPFIKSKSPPAESVAEFFERRLGREIVEKAADPFIAGIFAGNPENLSIKSSFPRLYELEKKYGSLLVGALLAKSEKADKNFPRSFSFKNGIQTLPNKLAEVLGETVKTNKEILKIEKSGRKFTVETDTGKKTFDALIVATPADSAAKLIKNLDEDLSELLKSIYYPPIIMVFFGIKKDKIKFNLDGFGFLIPGSENRKILGTLWNSAVFTNRAPVGFHLLTTFVGGARNAELFGLADAEIVQIVFEELGEILGLREMPDFVHLKRWIKAIPQYNLGYDKVEEGLAAFSVQNRGMFFCSNFYKGISVGDCIKNAYQSAAEIEQFLVSNEK